MRPILREELEEPLLRTKVLVDGEGLLLTGPLKHHHVLSFAWEAALGLIARAESLVLPGKGFLHLQPRGPMLRLLLLEEVAPRLQVGYLLTVPRELLEHRLLLRLEASEAGLAVNGDPPEGQALPWVRLSPTWADLRAPSPWVLGEDGLSYEGPFRLRFPLLPHEAEALRLRLISGALG